MDAAFFSGYTPPVLTPEDQKTLLELARGAVAAAARREEPPPLPAPSPALRENGAAFVTLRAAGELRGCVGHVDAREPLWESVRDMAFAAAAHDRRFSPVRPEEIPGIDLEISVLSPLTPYHPDRFEAGVHGLTVTRGETVGLLLPQVATEWGWDREEFVRQTFVKAGLTPGDPQARIDVFTVERFGSAARI